MAKSNRWSNSSEGLAAAWPRSPTKKVRTEARDQSTCMNIMLRAAERAEPPKAGGRLPSAAVKGRLSGRDGVEPGAQQALDDGTRG
ncbi:hypothetical protein, partial [Streptomyces sp. NPDC019890]|uniref:hypothetical protein n=1 Tax=Streptomyces sp. NPDC019890 TaxID=3365064 RepID=UPI003850BEE6